MLSNIKGVIFDMDGTLVDSMWIWEKIDIDFLKKRDINLPQDLREHIEHLSFPDVARYFKQRFNLLETIDEIMNEWNDMALYEYTHNVKLKPKAKDFLFALKSKNIKVGLATSNSTFLLEMALKNNGVYECFDTITTTCEVDRGKNFPDIYLLAAKKLGVLPEECMVFEDILPAVMGAKAAGMKVVGVYDPYSELQMEDIKKAADYYISEYKDIINSIKITD